MAFLLLQALQPVADRLATSSVTKEYQRNLSRLLSHKSIYARFSVPQKVHIKSKKKAERCGPA